MYTCRYVDRAQYRRLRQAAFASCRLCHPMTSSFPLIIMDVMWQGHITDATMPMCACTYTASHSIVPECMPCLLTLALILCPCLCPCCPCSSRCCTCECPACLPAACCSTCQRRCLLLQCLHCIFWVLLPAPPLLTSAHSSVAACTYTTHYCPLLHRPPPLPAPTLPAAAHACTTACTPNVHCFACQCHCLCS